ncbi:hypothetical protein [Actinomadura sp. DC4]|uniref:hypothetical protein n=1 Tax=Actinomadura sp. DC4 TaxID=3055069 RepID=UPI0025B140A1|nr:hypothetical protein [Actinomadura sp. DC4]MDN3354820.1 hypothetical protein [Actinomadura sp. DC4]
MPSKSEPGDRMKSLGVRRSVELPDSDVDTAGDLAPAEEPGQKDERPASSGQETGGASPVAAGGTSADRTPAKEEERKTVTVSEVAVTPPSVNSTADAGDELPPDRPKKTVLAGVAIGGAVVLAIPILLIGRGSHDHKKEPAAAAAATVLPGDGQQPGAFTSASPTVTPTPTVSKKKKDKPKASKSATPKTSPKASSKAAGDHKVRVQSVSNQKPLAGGPPWKSLRLHSPRDIYPGKTVRTNRIALTMQAGGNLVLRDKSNKVIWSTGTHTAGVYAELQTDGNLVLYAGDRHAVWAAGCFGHNNPTMVLQSDGNVVILDSGGHPIWATGTNR